jgi:hypothetical protein
MVAWLARIAAVRGRFNRQSAQCVVTLPMAYALPLAHRVDDDVMLS